MTSYKYDFELSSKRRNFLWLYHVIPNIDLIKEIYKLKEDSELEDTLAYHGLCPMNITSTSSWVPVSIRDTPKAYYHNRLMSLNVLTIKLIKEAGFICTFVMEENDYCDSEIEEIHHGNWISVVPNINTNPSLRVKIKIMNLVYSSLLCFMEDLHDRLRGLHQLYIHNRYVNIYRIGYDQRGTLYIPTTIDALSVV